MTTTPKKKIDIVEVLKYIGIIITSLTATTVVNSSGNESVETQIAIIEVKQEAMEKDFPRIMTAQTQMQKTLDSLVIMMRKDLNR